MGAADYESLTSNLSAYLDGELSPDEVRAVDSLLERSPEARQLLADLREVVRGLHSLPRTAAPRELLPRVLAEAEGVAAPPQPARVPRIYRITFQAGGAIAAAAACIFVGVLIAPMLREDVRESAVAPAEASDDFATLTVPTVRDAPRASIRSDQLKTLGYVGDGWAGAAADEAAARGGRAARDSRVARGDAAGAEGKDRHVLEASELARTAGGAGEIGFVAAALSDPSAVNVIISPRSRAEFDLLNREMAAWQVRGETLEAARRTVAGSEVIRVAPAAVATSAASPAEASPSVAQRYKQTAVDAVQFNDLLVTLNDAAPRQVQVLLPAEQVDVAAAEAEPDAASPDTLREKVGAGFVAAAEAPAAPPTPAAASSAPESQPAAARETAAASSRRSGSPREQAKAVDQSNARPKEKQPAAGGATALPPNVAARPDTRKQPTGATGGRAAGGGGARGGLGREQFGAPPPASAPTDADGESATPERAGRVVRALQQPLLEIARQVRLATDNLVQMQAQQLQMQEGQRRAFDQSNARYRGRVAAEGANINVIVLPPPPEDAATQPTTEPAAGGDERSEEGAPSP